MEEQKKDGDWALYAIIAYSVLLGGGGLYFGYKAGFSDATNSKPSKIERAVDAKEKCEKNLEDFLKECHDEINK